MKGLLCDVVVVSRLLWKTIGSWEIGSAAGATVSVMSSFGSSLWLAKNERKAREEHAFEADEDSRGEMLVPRMSKVRSTLQSVRSPVMMAIRGSLRQSNARKAA